MPAHSACDTSEATHADRDRIMTAATCARRAVALATCITLALGPGTAFAAQRSGRQGQTYAVPRDSPVRPAPPQTHPGYDNGFRDGQRQGALDARGNRAADFARSDAYRSGDAGYDRALGSRDGYRTEFRRGFELGYRQAYESARGVRDDRRDERERRWTRGYQEPATSHGYRDGYNRGRSDGRARGRYDPVRAGDYRAGDNGYSRDYGSKDAYKNNYRTGFRQGYEDGYRDGGRR
jgi:hypothetical protein